MDVRFEDHPGFQRGALLAALGGGALAALVSPVALVASSSAGSALALAFEPALSARERGRRAGVAAACALAGVAAAVRAGPGWLLPLCGALLGLAFALARRDRTRRDGSAGPRAAMIAFGAALCALVLLLASSALPPLAAALRGVLPEWIANAATGAALGLWAAIAAAPLHLVFGADPVEARLCALRPSLPQEIRVLAERAVAALRGAAEDLPQASRALDLRALLQQLALAALGVAERAASLDRAAAPLLEEGLQRRCAHLTRSAAEAEDPAARASYQRAVEALEAQLEHFRRVRRARERALALLHEQVANLERARFSLTLLRGSDPARGAAELDLLHDRLQHGAAVFEAEEDLAAPAAEPARA